MLVLLSWNYTSQFSEGTLLEVSEVVEEGLASCSGCLLGPACDLPRLQNSKYSRLPKVWGFIPLS